VLVRAGFERLFDQIDILVTPVTAAGPSTVDRPDRVERNGQSVPFRDVVMGYTVPQDLAGLPVCAIPAGWDDDGIPVAIQLTARFGDDRTALRAAAGLEAAIDLPRRWPAIAQ
jgi:Asp-tRNA(Asn)/Glu-tRNA(Gln) amidotransferase A subunit family amidase